MTEKNIPKKPDVRVDITKEKAYVDGFLSARTNESDWKKAKDTFQTFIDNILREAGATVGTINGRDVWRLSEFPKDKVNYQKMREEYPELFEQFTTQEESKRSGPIKGAMDD